MGQTSIFDYLYQEYKITKPIRLIEMFAGYGSQHLALKYLGLQVESHKIIEWAVPSIQAYKDLHFTNKNNDYTVDMTSDELINKLLNYGISSNYNEPMTYEQIKRKGYEWQKQVYNNIKNTNNLVNIMNVKGEDLEISELDKYDYILTYSFPCQDLSLAGKLAGMDEDSETRSSMLWQVKRILDELNQTKSLPQILLMENVPQVIAKGNMQNMEKWDLFLSRLGYKSYIKNLIATDYGIPQIRNRTFMISILGDYSYTFPKPMPLELKLSDLLEPNVDEKYYLSDEILEHIIKTAVEHKNYTQYDRYNGEFESLCRVWKNLSPTIHTKSNEIKIYEEVKQEYRAYDGDLIGTIPAMERVVVQKGKIQTIYSDKSLDKILSNIVDVNGVSKTITANPQRATIDGATLVVVTNTPLKTRKITPIVESKNKRLHETLDKVESNETQILDCYNRKTHIELSPTITTGVDFRNSTFLYNDLRIRKLSTRECFRLMGVKDDDFDKIKDNQSNSSLYHLAGDSIVVNVLMAIFKQLL